VKFSDWNALICRDEVDGLLCIPDDLDSSYVPSLRPGNNVALDSQVCNINTSWIFRYQKFQT